MHQHELAFVVQQQLVVHLDGLLEHVVIELVPHKSRRGNQHALDHIEVDMPQDALHNLLVELGQTLLVLLDATLALARDGDLDLAPHQRHAGGDQADVGQSLLHDDGGHIRRLCGIAGHLDALQGDGVPLGLAQLKLAI